MQSIRSVDIFDVLIDIAQYLAFQNGWTALHWACQKKDELVSELVNQSLGNAVTDVSCYHVAHSIHGH